MSGVSATYRRLLRREVVDICVLIFIADVVTGVQTPLFSLFTTSLGASFGLLGFITAVLGLTRLVSAVPLGMLSDRLDRKTVLVGGMIAFAVSFVLYALAPSAGWIVVPRVVMALAMVATFPLGIAYIGDIVETRDRGAAIGVYTAAMGSGFAVGPLLGTWVASVAGFPAAYLCGAAIAVFGAVFAAVRLIRKKAESGQASLAPRLVDLPAFAALVKQPAMVMACVANIAMTLSMTGAIFTYFPVYARGVGITTVTIGTLFAWRSIASAAGRIPMGPLSARLPAHWTLAGVLVIEAAINLSISRTSSPLALTMLLILEGIGFGIFLVSGQTAVASAAGRTNRGAAVGLFWMAGSLGDLFGPIALGVIAQELGLIAVFTTVAVVVVIGAVMVAGFGAIDAYRTRRAAVPAS
ncbi:MAG TPA: MFS transporter [Candidatus Dormibacteraeota bacterium]|nr:MFS transporter [Candidatus Dormibacteraeota bacterium]